MHVECMAANASAPSQWKLCFDIDEFLVVAGQTLEWHPLVRRGNATFVLHDYLDNAIQRREAAIVLDRINHGPGAHVTRPEGLVINEYTQREYDVVQKSHAVSGKPLVFVDALVRGDLHTATVRSNFKVVTADHDQWSAESRHRIFDPIHINHYWTRSQEECYAYANSERLAAFGQANNWRLKCVGGA